MAVLVDQRAEKIAVEPRRIENLDGVAVALLPVVKHAAVQALRPRHPGLEESEPQRREPVGDAAEEQGFRDRLAALREATDLVVLVARDRGVRSPADRTGVKRRRDAELDALRPHRVVVVGTVDAEAILVE